MVSLQKPDLPGSLYHARKHRFQAAALKPRKPRCAFLYHRQITAVH
jgi:hypothetical protein